MDKKSLRIKDAPSTYLQWILVHLLDRLHLGVGYIGTVISNSISVNYHTKNERYLHHDYKNHTSRDQTMTPHLSRPRKTIFYGLLALKDDVLSGASLRAQHLASSCPALSHTFSLFHMISLAVLTVP